MSKVKTKPAAGLPVKQPVKAGGLVIGTAPGGSSSGTSVGTIGGN